MHSCAHVAYNLYKKCPCYLIAESQLNSSNYGSKCGRHFNIFVTKNTNIDKRYV